MYSVRKLTGEKHIRTGDNKYMNKQKLIKQVIGPKYQLEYLKDIGTNSTIIRLTNRLTQKHVENVYNANQSATSQFSFEKMTQLVRDIQND